MGRELLRFSALLYRFTWGTTTLCLPSLPPVEHNLIARLKHVQINAPALKAVLSGRYTLHDLREFVQLCHNLALPLIRSKIHLGKLNPSVLGLTENDIVQDLLAELFRRDEENRFPNLQRFFEQTGSSLEEMSPVELLHELWRLICATVKHEMTRLYTELDPTLAKILRNTKLAAEKTNLFDEIDRFGETVLVPRHHDARFDLPPMDLQYLETAFSAVVKLCDNTLTLVHKLHDVLTTQERYQKAVPLVSVALMFKGVYALDSHFETITPNEAEQTLAHNDMALIVEHVCSKLRRQLHERYVIKGKKENDIFEKYIAALKNILLDSATDAVEHHLSLMEHLREHIPHLTSKEYRQKHKSTLEYFVKLGKNLMKDEFRQRQV